MSIKDDIDKAIVAHGRWKSKLAAIVETGESDVTPEHVSKDFNCSFGKWLHYRIDPSEKRSALYEEIVALHRAFHKEAGEILDLALKREIAAANERMSLGSEFRRTSSELLRKLEAWKEELS